MLGGIKYFNVQQIKMLHRAARDQAGRKRRRTERAGGSTCPGS
jgi:hypothetical protein